MSTSVLSGRALNRATLARQMLLGRTEETPAGAVARLAGMQAQEAAPPFVGLWSRLGGFAAADLLATLRERRVVRATAMRGTLHLLTAEDFLAWRGPGGDGARGVKQALATLGPRAAGIEPERVLPVARALFRERPRTFNDARAALAAAFPGADERALGFVARMGVPLVMIPSGDRWGFPADPVFGLAEDWLGAAPANADAGPALARSYLAAFGPASPADFAAWSGLTGAKAIFERVQSDLNLIAFRDERERELFDLPDAPRPDPETAAPVRFLPAFDNLLLAHDDRSRVIADEHRPLVVTKNLRVHPTFLLDGVVAGTWKVERKRVEARLTLAPFAPVPDHLADDLAREGEALLRWLEPDAGSHLIALARSS
jgi:hypothetical protein